MVFSCNFQFTYNFKILSGVITLLDLKRCFARMHLPVFSLSSYNLVNDIIYYSVKMSDQELVSYMKRLDKSNDGQIQLQEFIEMSLLQLTHRFARQRDPSFYVDEFVSMEVMRLREQNSKQKIIIDEQNITIQSLQEEVKRLKQELHINIRPSLKSKKAQQANMTQLGIEEVSDRKRTSSLVCFYHTCLTRIFINHHL